MNTAFSTVKEELRFLLDRYLIEERRSEIYRNYKKSQKEVRKDKLEFSSNINHLKDMMNQ